MQLHHCLLALLPHAETVLTKLGLWKAPLHCWRAQHKVCADIIKIPNQTSERDPERQRWNNEWRLGETHVYLSSFKFSLLERVTAILILTDSLGNLLHFRSVQNNGIVPKESLKTALAVSNKRYRNGFPHCFRKEPHMFRRRCALPLSSLSKSTL